MFTAIWALFVGVTIGAWLLSTLHVLWYQLEPSIPTPWPLAPERREERFVKFMKVWAYAPTLLAQAAWETFETSPKGSAWLKWLREKV